MIASAPAATAARSAQVDQDQRSVALAQQEMLEVQIAMAPAEVVQGQNEAQQLDSQAALLGGTLPAQALGEGLAVGHAFHHDQRAAHAGTHGQNPGHGQARGRQEAQVLELDPPAAPSRALHDHDHTLRGAPEEGHPPRAAPQRHLRFQPQEAIDSLATAHCTLAQRGFCPEEGARREKKYRLGGSAQAPRILEYK